MIDIHSHVLPGVDDGAGSLEEAVAMCRRAAADGCEALLATPHQRRGIWDNDDRDRLAALLAEVQAAVGPKPRLALGAEIHVDSGILREVERLPEGGLLPLAGSRYLLLEFSRHRVGPDPVSVVHELVVAGWHPILAHPEHIGWLAEDLPLLEDLVAAGACLQITAMSLTGEFGKAPQACCLSLLDADLVHFVASDAHGLDWRPPGLSRAHQAIAARFGEDLARRLTSANPRSVLADRTLHPRPDLEAVAP